MTFFRFSNFPIYPTNWKTQKQSTFVVTVLAQAAARLGFKSRLGQCIKVCYKINLLGGHRGLACALLEDCKWQQIMKFMGLL